MNRVLFGSLFMLGCTGGTPTPTSPTPSTEVVPPTRPIDVRSDILLPRAGCIRTGSDGAEATFDAFGWVVSEDGLSFDYERVDGHLIQRTFVDGEGITNVHTFDAFENIDSWTRGSELQYSCTFAPFEGGPAGELTCQYGAVDIFSTLDGCGEVVLVEAGGRTSMTEITYTQGCVRSLAVTEAFGLVDTVEFDAEGREIRRTVADPDTSTVITYSWDCSSET